MKNTLKGSVILVTLAFLCSSAAIAQTCPGESTWVNELGSTLYIEDIDSEGKITGIYINRAEGYGCRNTPYPVTGWVLENTNTISFSVKWENTTENCYSITAWTGFFSSDCGTLTTLWQMVINGTTKTSQIWQGEDTFTTVTQKTSPFKKKEASN